MMSILKSTMLIWFDLVILLAIISIAVNLEGGCEIPSRPWSLSDLTWGIFMIQVH